MTTQLIRHLSSETVDLTPALAAEFATMTASLTERDMDPKRIDMLKKRVLSGRALAFNWAKIRVGSTGDVLRGNGHHSSTMLAGLNGSFPAGLKAHIDIYEVDTPRQIPIVFRMFDSRQSARTVADVCGVYQMTVPELRNVPRDAARKAIEGVAWHRGRIVGLPNPKGDDIFDLFNDPQYHDFVQMVGRIYSRKKTGEFTPPVIGAMWAISEKHPLGIVESFWQAVAKQGAGNDDKHPTTVLDAWLVDSANAAPEKRPSQMEVFRACLVCWNAHRNNKPLERIGKFDPKKGFPELE